RVTLFFWVLSRALRTACVLICLSFSLYMFVSKTRPPPSSTLFPYTTLFRSHRAVPESAHSWDRYPPPMPAAVHTGPSDTRTRHRSEEHTSELQSRFDLVCRLLLEKKKSSECMTGDA